MSYFTTLITKASDAVSSTIEAVQTYCLENPTTSALIGTATTVGGTVLMRRTQLYQRNSTLINTLGAVAVVGAGVVGYKKVQPYISNLLKAKELLEKSNSGRLAMTPEQLNAIDVTNIQSWVVTLEALRNALNDLFAVDLILQATNAVRDRQRQLALTDATAVLPLFNHYRIHVYSRLVTGVVLTAVVRYFNAISVGVTFRYSETDRIALEQTTLSEQLTLRFEALSHKNELHVDNPDIAPRLSDEEMRELADITSRYNTPAESMYLRTLSQSGVTDVLNLVYQSTISVLFPVVSQIAMMQLMESDVPLNYHMLSRLQQAQHDAKNTTSNQDRDTVSTTDAGMAQNKPLITFPQHEFFFDENWIGTEATSSDLMLLLERTAIRTFATLLQPSEWFIRFRQDGMTTPSSSNQTTPTSTPALKSTPSEISTTDSTNDNTTTSTTATIPITDYILGHGLGCHLNSTLHETPNSTHFAFLTSNHLQALLAHSFNIISHQHALEKYTQQLQFNPNAQIPQELLQSVGWDSTTNDGTHPTIQTLEAGPQPPLNLPIIAYKSLRHSPIVSDANNLNSTPRTQTPLPVLAHALLPIGALLYSVSQRVVDLQPQPLKVLPSVLGLVPSTSAVPQSTPQSLSPIGDMLGLGSNPLFGGQDPMQQQQSQQPVEQFIIADSREIYLRRVLQVIGELHSIVSCPDTDILGLGTDGKNPFRHKNGGNGIFSNFGQFGPISTPTPSSTTTTTTTTRPQQVATAVNSKTATTQSAALNQALNEHDKEQMLESVDDIDVMLHPWHYPGQFNPQFDYKNVAKANDTKTIPMADSDDVDLNDYEKVKYDHTNALGQLEDRLVQLPFFAEVWKDIKLLLVHTGTSLHEQSMKTIVKSKQGHGNGNNSNFANVPSINSTPNAQNSIYFTPSMQSEPPSNTLVLTKRAAQLWDSHFPSLEQAQIQQQQQLQVAQQQQQRAALGGANAPAPQNVAMMLLVPGSAAFQLTMNNYHRKYVLDTMLKTIAGSIGTEKAGGNFMDLFGLNFGSEELGMLQSLLMGDGNGDENGQSADLTSLFGAGGDGNGAAPSDDDLIKMLTSLNGISPDELNALGLGENNANIGNAAATANDALTPSIGRQSQQQQPQKQQGLGLLSPGPTQGANGLSEEDVLMNSLFNAFAGGQQPAATPKVGKKGTGKSGAKKSTNATPTGAKKSASKKSTPTE